MGKLLGLEKNRVSKLCIVGNRLEELDEDDSQILSNALNDPTWTANALSKSLRRLGVEIGRDSIKSHRERQCLCWRN